MPYNPEKTVVFIHIPKTAGTSIEKALNLTELHNSFTYPSPQHFQASAVKRIVGDYWDKMFKFSVKRDIYDRMVSEFLWRLRMLQPPELVRLNLVNTEQSFNEFLTFVTQVTDFTQPTYDHFRPQNYFLDEPLDMIFDFENLQELEDHFNIKLPKLNHRKQEPNDLLSPRNKDLIYQLENA